MQSIRIPDPTHAQLALLASVLGLSIGDACAVATRGEIERRGLADQIGLPGWRFAREGDVMTAETPIGSFQWPLPVVEHFVRSLGEFGTGTRSRIHLDMDAGIQMARKGNGVILTRFEAEHRDDGKTVSLSTATIGSIINEITRAL